MTSVIADAGVGNPLVTECGSVNFFAGVVDTRPKPERISLVNGDGCVDGLFTPRSLQTDVGLKLEGGSPVNQSADVVFLAPPSPKGTIIAVYSACLEGNCSCKHYIGGHVAQVRPCRVAAELFRAGARPTAGDRRMFDGFVDGFDIVDSPVEPYDSENYDSALNGSNCDKMTQILLGELAEGKVDFVPIVAEKPVCIHSLGCVSKSDGVGIRPITDCSRPRNKSINCHQDALISRFRYKTVDDAVHMLSQGAYMSVVDIKNAYRSVCINPDHSVYQGFRWNFGDGRGARLMVERRLCFGTRCGPFYFNLISDFITRSLTVKYGMKVVNYLDDFLVMGDTYDSCLWAQQMAIAFLRNLGFQISWKKVTSPSKITVYLGIILDSEKMELRLPEGKLGKLSEVLKKFDCKKSASKKQLEKLAGILSHCSTVVRGGRTFSRRVYDLCKIAARVKNRIVCLNALFQADIEWWLRFAECFNGRAAMLRRDLGCDMTSDSSKMGFAVYLNEDWLAGSWKAPLDIQGISADCVHVHSPPGQDVYDATNINELELWPVVAGAKRWCHVFRNRSVRVGTDNTQVLTMLRKGRSRNKTCMNWLRELFWLSFLFNFELIPYYVRSQDNFVADTMSRLGYDKYKKVFVRNYNRFSLCCRESILHYCIVNS